MCCGLGSCCAGICCGACKCDPVKSGPISRIPYLFLFISAGIFSIVMSLYGEEKLNLVFFDVQMCSTTACMGNGSVYRTSFILFGFELIHVCIIGVCFVAFHWLFFFWKLIIFIVCLTLSLVYSSDGSNDFFNGYANYFARFVSACYLILQILILIIWAYEINEQLVIKTDEYNTNNENADRDEDERGNQCIRNPWAWLFALLTIGFYVATFTILGYFYVWYAADKDCAVNITLITITIVLCVLNAIISFLRADGSFFVSSVVSLYATFLLFAGLQSVDNSQCNVFNTEDKGSLWIGYCISFLSIAYASLRADRIGLLTYDQHKENENENLEDEVSNGSKKSKNDYSEVTVDDDEDEDAKGNYEDVDDNENDVDEDEEKLKEKALKKSHTFFHVILMFAACYYAMLFTSWAKSTTIDTKGETALWINMGSQWCCIFLFYWTLLAPLICPSRFQSEEDEDAYL